MFSSLLCFIEKQNNWESIIKSYFYKILSYIADNHKKRVLKDEVKPKICRTRKHTVS